MIIYHQETGEIGLDTEKLGIGYSGHEEGKNNRLLEWKASMGPIPRGKYIIGGCFNSESKGPIVFHLEPKDHSACGRSGFMIHGDSSEHPGEASHGCIILSRNIREKIRDSNQKELEVL